ncbi:GlcNAc-transferase family protein [Erwinia sorbitola]|uniref:Glycosyltransferase n=1 Tax=Erwinia sorbitola TaxID=2681984 RepID=A0A6I6EHG5_9GAMM|nr:GlcNAc-transferase family protein [Erwinia sorbitola]MTD28136.1 glycosyltransferase [Erwinia sorbitola]QGU85826.1 glycosyltransferase [Erwinia sorbitola]
MDNVPYIFVSIASYRDSELIPTLEDMISRCDNPHALRISICWQCSGEISIFLNHGMQLIEKRLHNGFNLYVFHYKKCVIRVISVHYYLSQGACWARHIAETLFDNEKYFLQIDSHCRFISGWDSEMITMLDRLLPHSPKPVITGYPPGYQPDKPTEKSGELIRIIFRGFSPDKILQLSPLVMNEKIDSPIRGSYLAGGFIFSLGSFVTDIPNDPNIFFEGEEIAMAVRAFTHGYDIYHPDKVLLWHFYGREEHVKVWSDHGEEAKSKGNIKQAWWERDASSKKRVNILLGQEKDTQCNLGMYGLGSQRTLSQFERRAGVHFSTCQVHPDVTGDQHLSYFSCGDLVESEWLSQLVGIHKKTIEFTPEQIDLLDKNALYWYIAIYTKSNHLIEQKTVYQNEIEEKMSSSDNSRFSIPVEITSNGSLTPYSVRICSFSGNSGWGETLEEAW